MEVLNTILSVTATIIEDAKAIATDLENNEASITADVETYLAAITTQVNNLALKAIDVLKEGATEDGLAVLQCIDGLEESINIAYEKTITLAGSCISEEYSAIHAVLTQILDNVQLIEEEVKAEVETLDACTSSDLICLLAFANSLVETAKEIAEIVPTDVNAVVTVIQEVISHVSTCALNENVKQNAQDLFNDLVRCIKV